MHADCNVDVGQALSPANNAKIEIRGHDGQASEQFKLKRAESCPRISSRDPPKSANNAKITHMRPLLTLTLLSTLTAATRTPVPAVEEKPHTCTIPGITKPALCATYLVWEDRDRKAGRKIGLNIVILPALTQEKAEPIFVFGGGPGEGITESAFSYALLPFIRAHHDIVLIDQRGTGRIEIDVGSRRPY
jgi:hypothetical protein